MSWLLCTIALKICMFMNSCMLTTVRLLLPYKITITSISPAL